MNVFLDKRVREPSCLGEKNFIATVHPSIRSLVVAMPNVIEVGLISAPWSRSRNREPKTKKLLLGAVWRFSTRFLRVLPFVWFADPDDELAEILSFQHA